MRAGAGSKVYGAASRRQRAQGLIFPRKSRVTTLRQLILNRWDFLRHRRLDFPLTRRPVSR